jgi:hypothetical protein
LFYAFKVWLPGPAVRVNLKLLVLSGIEERLRPRSHFAGAIDGERCLLSDRAGDFEPVYYSVAVSVI